MTNTSSEVRFDRYDESKKIIIADLSECHHCKSTGLTDNDVFCPNCAFPQRGTQKDMWYFLWKVKNKKELLADHKKAINKARNILYILAGLNLVLGIIIGLIITVNIPIFLGCLLGAGIYFALGLWSRTQPFPAILSGLFVYIVFIVINAILDPHTIYQGIIWKVIIISAFIYGYNSVKDSRNLEKELESMNKAKDLSTEE